MSKNICFNLLPVSPFVHAWVIDLNVLDFKDSEDAEPTRYPCSLEKFGSTASHMFPELVPPDGVFTHNSLPESVVPVPVIVYRQLPQLITFLEAVGDVSISPNGQSGMYVSVDVTEGGEPFFKALANE